jgi:hypothetical protein
MSRRSERARPIKKIKLRIILQDDGPSVARVSKALKKSAASGNRLVILSETTDPAEAIREILRVREAVRGVKDSPKDFK